MIGGGRGPRAFSYAATTCRTISSANDCPIIWIDAGSPSAARPVSNRMMRTNRRSCVRNYFTRAQSLSSAGRLQVWQGYPLAFAPVNIVSRVMSRPEFALGVLALKSWYRLFHSDRSVLVLAAHLYQYRGPTEKGGASKDAPPWFHSLKVVVADRTVVAAAAKAASLESTGRSRKDKGHCGRVSRLAPCYRARVACLA